MTAQVSYSIMHVKDVERAAAFFGSVMGWDLKRGSAGGYHVLGSEPGCGIAPMADAAGVEPALTAAFEPDDMDAGLAAVTAHGGSVLSDNKGDAFYGRWAECTDDQGTQFALFAPASGH